MTDNVEIENNEVIEEEKPNMVTLKVSKKSKRSNQSKREGSYCKRLVKPFFEIII